MWGCVRPGVTRFYLNAKNEKFSLWKSSGKFIVGIAEYPCVLDVLNLLNILIIPNGPLALPKDAWLACCRISFISSFFFPYFIFSHYSIFLSFLSSFLRMYTSWQYTNVKTQLQKLLWLSNHLYPQVFAGSLHVIEKINVINNYFYHFLCLVFSEASFLVFPFIVFSLYFHFDSHFLFCLFSFSFLPSPLFSPSSSLSSFSSSLSSSLCTYGSCLIYCYCQKGVTLCCSYLVEARLKNDVKACRPILLFHAFFVLYCIVLY